MIDHPFKEIIKLLQRLGIHFELLTHEAVYTSEKGAKSLLLKSGNEFILAVLPGNKRLNSKKLKAVLKIKDLRFATSTEVAEVMGCQIGACYPLGNIISVQTVVDSSLSENEIIAFNPGVHTKTIKMRWEDYLKVVEPKLVDIT